jgi:tryptophan 2,3-dioxygenase
MTPSDYSAIRPHLGASSGFQSCQYRMLEFLLGNKNRAMLEIHRDDKPAYEALAAMLASPSLYDESLKLLDSRGFAIPARKCERDWSEPYEPDPQVEEAWLAVYRNPEAHWDLYELAEKLVDLEYRFQQWRFVHMKTVERIIGYKAGTGGTAGVPYLAKVVDQHFFPELLKLRTSL